MGEFNGESKSIQRQYDWSNTVPSEAVINAIASLEDVEPVALSEHLNITLYDYVDPDALDSLTTDDTPPTISFTIDEYKIQIDGNTLIIYYD